MPHKVTNEIAIQATLQNVDFQSIDTEIVEKIYIFLCQTTAVRCEKQKRTNLAAYGKTQGRKMNFKATESFTAKDVEV